MHQKAKSQHAHFRGKEALEHVLEARKKGAAASDEIHGAEMPGHLSAFADSAKETSLLFLLLWAILTPLSHNNAIIPWILLIFASAYLIWKTGRSALLGWMRLERMHRVIEEERWEIEHHRGQEKEELRALYQAKGFSGRLLDEVVEVLMADDNRLLEVMLQEELGLKLESQEHPLKQACGAALGALFAGSWMFLALFLLPSWGAVLSSALVIALMATLTAKWERNQTSKALIWNLGIAALSSATALFAMRLLSS